MRRAMFLFLIAGTLGVGLFFGSASHADPPLPPVLQIYQQHVTLAELEVTRQKTQSDYDNVRRQAVEELWTEGAIPEQTVLDWRRICTLDALEVQRLEAKLKIAQVRLAVATQRIAAGQPVEVCSP